VSKPLSSAVVPASKRREIMLLLVCVLVLLLIATAYLSSRPQQREKSKLLDWQLSAFYDLGAVDQAVYNALRTSVSELWWLHGDMLTANKANNIDAVSWPSVQQLAEYYVVPPFAQDVSSRQQGDIQWRRAAAFSFEGLAVYFGHRGTRPQQSAYLLVLNHAHKGASFSNGAAIWLHSDSNVVMPTIIKQNSLIVNGWKQVVAYSGAMEVKRLKGDDNGG